MKKRLLAGLLLLAMVISLLPPVTVAAANSTYREDYADVISQAKAMTFPEDKVSTKEADCPACGAKNAVWQPLTQLTDTTKGYEGISGHYYLAENITSSYSQAAIYLTGSGSVCLHMNGKTIENTSGVPAVRVWGAALNLMGGGKLIGGNFGWGALTVHANNANIYGTTFRSTDNSYYALDCRSCTTNVYSSTIERGVVLLRSDSRWNTNVTIEDCDFSSATVNMNEEVAADASATGQINLTVNSGSVGTINAANDVLINGGTVAKVVGTENADLIKLSGDPVVNGVDLSASAVLLTVGTLAEGAKINLNKRAGVFTTPFKSKAAAEAAIAYFTNAGDTITVTEDNCLTAGASSYLVGYSKVDINPYAQDGTILPLGLAGFNDESTRLAKPEKYDDNGDGEVDANDGIFATCTAITDKEGNTALLFTADLLWGYNDNYGPAVMEALLGEEFKDEGLDESRIFFNGSHNHFAPNMADDSASDNHAAYNAYLKEQFVAAARQALADRAWADMYQGSMDVVDYFKDSAHKNEMVGDLLNDMQGKTVVTEKSYADMVGDNDVFFTCVRHYKMTEQKVKTETVTFRDGVPVSGEVDESAPQYTYYAGNGTNGEWVGVGHINTIYEHDPETGIIYDGTNDTQVRVKEYRKVIAWEEATPTDDTLRVVQFRFGDDSGKDPVVMINWRGHLPSCAKLSETSYYQVSGGMVNALRNAMAFSGYRASFFQGQTGNINMEHLGIEGSWMNSAPAQKTNIFGTELAQIALNVLEGADKINEDGGEIRSVDQIYVDRQYHSSVFEFIAARTYLREVAANDGNEIGRRVYTNLSYSVDAKGEPLVDKETGLPIDGEAVGEPIVQQEPITIPNADRANTMQKRYWHNILNNIHYEKVMLNALTIGDDFKLTSVAAEIFDHYIGEEGENLWDTLKAEHNDPFILGVTNSSTGSGYMPDKNTYHYMHSGKDPNYVVGTYESNGTRFREGYGEAVVQELDVMLDFLENDHPAGVSKEGNCQHCDKTVTWIDLSREVSEGDLRFEEQFASGHYYLPEGKTADLIGKEIPEGVEVCIDLGGQTLNIARGLKVYGKLNIVDSKSTGTVDGYEAYYQGGLFYVAATGEMNIYGGSFRYTGEQCPSRSSGGIVYVDGKFTMYDGHIQGTAVSFMGGAMVVHTTGKAFFRGGTIEEGSISDPNAAGNGRCVTVYGEVTLSGDPNIDSLFYIGQKDGQNLDAQKLNFDGVFTGKVYAPGVEITDPCIGEASVDADVSLGSVYDGEYNFYIEDGLVYKRLATDYVAQNEKTKEFIYGDYDDLNTVLQTLPDGSRVVMQANISSSATVAVNQNLQWELKGHTVNCSFTVAENKSISFTDCVGTGKVNLAKVTGTVGNASASEDGKTVYVPITGNDGYATLHQARVNIDELVLRADNQDENGKASPGIYFKHRFDGDDVVKDQVESYGIAFSLTGAPTAAELQAEGTLLYEDSVVYRSGNVVYTKMDGASFGKSDAESTSTLITGVMKEENGASINARNAQMPIYGVAYLKLTSGAVVFGQVRERTFQQQLEGIDNKWDALTHAQRKGVLKMYKVPTIKSVVDGWTVPNLKNPEKSQAAEEKDTLRILAIGNSHTVDTTSLLYKVFEAQKTENGYETAHGTYKNVMIGNMYYSGCAVSQHVGFETSNAPVYVYYTYTADGNGQKKQTTLRQALNDQVWDVVILHEMNSAAGAESTYTGVNKRNLQKHINYIKANCLNSDPKFIWNFSWANPTSKYLWGLGYPEGENYSWVDSYEKLYGNDYDYMLSQMVKMTKSYVMTNSDIDGVIPTGLAVDFLRKHEDNPDKEDPDVLLYRDYTHMSDFGRLMTSYLWFAAITGKTEIDSVNIDVIPKYYRVEQNWHLGDMEVTQDMKDMIQAAVQHAISQKGTLLPE